MTSEMSGGSRRIGGGASGGASVDANVPGGDLVTTALKKMGDTRPLSILIVDDDAALRMTLQRMLEPGAFGRYIVECAQDGGEAIEHIKARTPDLIITDIYMPVSDGFELINWMRAQSLTVPVLVMSGSGSTASSYYDPLRAAERLGAAAILDKPFRAWQLIEAIDRILAGRTPPPRR